MLGMRKTIVCLQLCGLAMAAAGSLAAQEASMAPPKVLVITREFLRPGKAGAPHEKTESAFVSAATAAKWPEHYLAMDSMSGQPRSLFLFGYDSFEGWEKDNLATLKNSTYSAALAKASVADGDLLNAIETSVFVYREDLSYQANIDVAKMRYFDITRFKVKPGHYKEWEELGKMYKDNFSKAVPDAHWAIFEDMYGKDGAGIFIVINPMKSLAEVDKGFGDSKKFEESLGEEGTKKLHELMNSSAEFLEDNLFYFNSAESYPTPEWIKSDPEFWKPKARAAEKKPAQ